MPQRPSLYDHFVFSLAQRSPTLGPQRYRSVGHLELGRTERINDLHYFRFIYYLSLNNVLFQKMTRFSLLHLSMTLVLDTTLKGRSVKILSDIKPVRGAKRVKDHWSSPFGFFLPVLCMTIVCFTVSEFSLASDVATCLTSLLAL